MRLISRLCNVAGGERDVLLPEIRLHLMLPRKEVSAGAVGYLVISNTTVLPDGEPQNCSAKTQEANLKLSPKKCFLFQREVRYVGYILSEHGIATDSEKTEVVRSWPIPTSVKELQSFVGLCSYYS